MINSKTDNFLQYAGMMCMNIPGAERERVWSDWSRRSRMSKRNRKGRSGQILVFASTVGDPPLTGLHYGFTVLKKI